MATAEEPELTGQVLFYKQPEPFSLEKHRGLGRQARRQAIPVLLGSARRADHGQRIRHRGVAPIR